MYLSLTDLKELLHVLDDARREAAGPGHEYYCTKALTDADGNGFRWEPKLRTLKRVGHVYPDGTKLEEIPEEVCAAMNLNRPEDFGPDEEGKTVRVKPAPLGIRVPLGPHGRAHLGVNPETREVVCLACAHAYYVGADPRTNHEGGK